MGLFGILWDSSDNCVESCIIIIAGIFHGVYMLESSASNGHGSEGVDFKLNQQGAEGVGW